MKTAITTSSAPRPGGPYNQGVIANGFVFTAGFGPVDPATGEKPDGITAQTHQVLSNLEAVLAEAGLDLSDVVKVTAHLSSLELFGEFNAAYLERMPEPYPVRTTVGSELSGILVEIDVIAALR